MSKIKIITDSASDIDVKTAEEYGICLLPFTVLIDGKEYTDGVDLTPDEFYEKMRTSSELPKTSQVKTEQFTECFEKLYAEGYTELIYISICSTGSSTYNNALKAKELFFNEHPDAKDKVNITVIDSFNYTFTYGYPAVEAAAKAARGCSADEITAFIEEWLCCAEVHFVSYTLEYVRKSGRISAGAAFMGELLGLKPIISIIDGESKVTDKVRGEKGIIPKITEIAKNNMIPQTPYILLEGSLPDESAALKKEITKAVGYPPERVVKIGPTIASHAGPKVIGIVLKGQRRR
ncbi:DegV family protein [Ruminococcus sp. HUN007]|uniref:DegV family protein n=1 Tax=Ruminococcus sp. HUN007 TaxID=1514668 RepID=UPI0005D1EAB7|nr:DegV family protein [Ruminococcus sp. HUN007]